MRLHPNHYFSLLTAAAAIISGCAKPTPEPVPAPKPNPIDELMHARGYWDWQRSSARFASAIFPVDVGYTRQLVFRNDGYVAISHNQQLFSESVYELSTQVPAYCGYTTPTAIVKYRNEDGRVSNNDLKFYNVFISPTDTTLTLVGEQTCMRGGLNEYYTWHRLP
jgi:hypothetical protein